jgi:hypothetical protein
MEPKIIKTANSINIILDPLWLSDNNYQFTSVVTQNGFEFTSNTFLNDVIDYQSMKRLIIEFRKKHSTI